MHTAQKHAKIKNTPRKVRNSIKKDVVNPTDYLMYDHRWSCEDCTHFSPPDSLCTLGYVTEHHLKSQQTKDYILSGRIAFCRFHEID